MLAAMKKLMRLSATFPLGDILRYDELLTVSSHNLSTTTTTIPTETTLTTTETTIGNGPSIKILLTVITVQDLAPHFLPLPEVVAPSFFLIELLPTDQCPSRESLLGTIG